MSNSFIVFNFTLNLRPDFRIKSGRKTGKTDEETPPKLNNKALVQGLKKQFLTGKLDRDAQLQRFVKIINKRYEASEVNKQYRFPRVEVEGTVSRSSSIDSMNGTSVYKLSRQNKLTQRINTLPTDRPDQDSRMSARYAVRDRMDWKTNRKMTYKGSQIKSRYGNLNISIGNAGSTAVRMHTSSAEARGNRSMPMKKRTGLTSQESNTSKLTNPLVCSSVLKK